MSPVKSDAKSRRRRDSPSAPGCSTQRLPEGLPLQTPVKLVGPRVNVKTRLFIILFYLLCEGGVDVVGVVTPLVRGVAQVLHGDQVAELRVQLEVQEVEGKEEDREGQAEVEEERGELKERRTCTWMT